MKAIERLRAEYENSQGQYVPTKVLAEAILELAQASKQGADAYDRACLEAERDVLGHTLEELHRKLTDLGVREHEDIEARFDVLAATYASLCERDETRAATNYVARAALNPADNLPKPNGKPLESVVELVRRYETLEACSFDQDKALRERDEARAEAERLHELVKDLRYHLSETPPDPLPWHGKGGPENVDVLEGIDWVQDCQGKQDLDDNVIRLSSRFYPRGGGYSVLRDGKWEERGDRSHIPPFAVSSIIAFGEVFAENEFEGETEEEVKAKVEAWARNQLEQIRDAISHLRSTECSD